MLACPSGSASNVINITVIQMVVDYPTVFFEVNFLLGNGSNPSSSTLTNLTHVGYVTISSDFRVCTLKVLFQRLEYTDQFLPPLNNYQTAFAIQAATINAYCSYILPACASQGLDPSLIYSNTSQCVSYVSSISQAGWAMADQQAFGCVRLHLILVSIRPFVHCPHVGPTGGGKCVLHPYISFYEDETAQCPPDSVSSTGQSHGHWPSRPNNMPPLPSPNPWSGGN